MPKPYFLIRPSGVYVRFLVPANLRPVVGSRYLVRPLGALRGDSARLLAAQMGVALSVAFCQMRGGGMVDVSKLLEKGRRGELSKFKLKLGADGLVVESDGSNLDNQAALDAIGRVTPEMLRASINVLGGSEEATDELPSKVSPLLSVMIGVHLADLTKAGRNVETVTESNHTLRLLLGVVGDKPVKQMTQADARSMLDAARLWPNNASKRPEFRGMDVMAIVAAGKAAQALPPNDPGYEDRPAAATIKKHRQRLSVFFNFLINSQELTINPLKGLAKPDDDGEEETGRAFTREELAGIFEPARFAAWSLEMPHRFWGPLLGLYTGARVNEVAQLYLDDVETVLDIPGIHIRALHPDQKLKGKSRSRRFVPLARPLLDAGFLRYVEDVRAAGHVRLFPHLPNSGKGYGKQLTRQFGVYLKKEVGITEFGMGFHAFRHTLPTYLERVGVAEATTAKITGHTVAGTVLRKHYIDPPTLPERLDALAKFQPGVITPTYQSIYALSLVEAHKLPAKWAAQRLKWRSKKTTVIE